MPETDGLQDAIVRAPPAPVTHLKIKVTSGSADFITLRSVELYE